MLPFHTFFVHYVWKMAKTLLVLVVCIIFLHFLFIHFLWVLKGNLNTFFGMTKTLVSLKYIMQPSRIKFNWSIFCLSHKIHAKVYITWKNTSFISLRLIDLFWSFRVKTWFLNLGTTLPSNSHQKTFEIHASCMTLI